MAGNMVEWTKVITNPLGLAGFALFLVFGFLGKVKRKDERKWFSPVAFGIAALALIGGLVIAYAQAPRPQAVHPNAAPSAALNCADVDQKTSGAGSPNVNCVNGNVNITVDQSSGTGTKPAAQPKPAQAEQKQ
jgi:hypothetical protein